MQNDESLIGAIHWCVVKGDGKRVLVTTCCERQNDIMGHPWNHKNWVALVCKRWACITAWVHSLTPGSSRISYGVLLWVKSHQYAVLQCCCRHITIQHDIKLDTCIKEGMESIWKEIDPVLKWNLLLLFLSIWIHKMTTIIVSYAIVRWFAQFCGYVVLLLVCFVSSPHPLIAYYSVNSDKHVLTAAETNGNPSLSQL